MTDIKKDEPGIIAADCYPWHRGLFDIAILWLGAYWIQSRYPVFDMSALVMLCAIMWLSNVTLVNIRVYRISATLRVAAIFIAILTAFSILLWKYPVPQLITAWSVVTPWALGSAIICIATNRSFDEWTGPILLSLGGVLIASLGYATFYANTQGWFQPVFDVTSPDQFVLFLFAALLMASRCAQPGSIIMLPGLAILAYVVVQISPELHGFTDILILLGYVNGAKLLSYMVYYNLANPETAEQMNERLRKNKEEKDRQRKLNRELFETIEFHARQRGDMERARQAELRKFDY